MATKKRITFTINPTDFEKFKIIAKNKNSNASQMIQNYMIDLIKKEGELNNGNQWQQ